MLIFGWRAVRRPGRCQSPFFGKREKMSEWHRWDIVPIIIPWELSENFSLRKTDWFKIQEGKRSRHSFSLSLSHTLSLHSLHSDEISINKSYFLTRMKCSILRKAHYDRYIYILNSFRHWYIHDLNCLCQSVSSFCPLADYPPWSSVDLLDTIIKTYTSWQRGCPGHQQALPH